MTLGENLQNLRKSAGLSQEEVAGRLFVSRQSVSKWENDQAEPGVENLKALAALYGVTMDALTGMTPPPGRSPAWTKWGDMVWSALADLPADVRAGINAVFSGLEANTGFWTSVKGLFTSEEPDTPVDDRERRAASFYHVVVWTRTAVVFLEWFLLDGPSLPFDWLAMLLGLICPEPFLWAAVQVCLWINVALNLGNLFSLPAVGATGLFLAYLFLCAFFRREVKDYFHIDSKGGIG